MYVYYNGKIADCQIEETATAYIIYSDSQDVPEDIIIDKFLCDFQEKYENNKLKIIVCHKNSELT